MSGRTLGILTIGQAPRADLAPTFDRCLGSGVERVEMGVLDGLSRGEISRRFASAGGDGVLVTRLLDGSSVTLGKARILPAANDRIGALADAGCRVVLLLCTGAFEGLEDHGTWLIEPDRVIPPVVSALLGTRQLGIIVPHASQIASEEQKWRVAARPPLCAAASPYAGDDTAIERAARDLRTRGADLLVLDCVGFTPRQRDLAAGASGLPVIQSSALVVRLAAEILG